jgi:diguanylate cyclase (GGDEF)-like protein
MVVAERSAAGPSPANSAVSLAGPGQDPALPSAALPSVMSRSDADRRRMLTVLGHVSPMYVEQLDRWTQVATDALNASVGLVLLLADSGQSLASSGGTAAWAGDRRRVPLAHVFCQWVVGHGRPVAIDDARKHGPLQAQGAAAELGMVGYAGAPIVVSGLTIGALCVIQAEARTWSEADLRLLNKLAKGLAYEIQLYVATVDLTRSSARLEAQSRIHELIADDRPLHRILEAIVASIEAHVPELHGSIVTLDEGHLAGRVDELVGERTYWPFPINGGEGARLGTLIVYGGLAPGDHDRRFLRDVARLAGIAVDTRRSHDRLVFAAAHDVLTGLANRSTALGYLDDVVRRAPDGTEPVSVLFIDLDRLGGVNASLGYEVGDHVIRQLAARVRSCTAEADLVARLGGEEFIIISVGGDDHAIDLARCVVAALRVPVTGLASRVELSVTGSIGITAIASDDVDAREAVCRADVAMTVAKSRGGDQYAVSALTDVAAPPRRLLIEGALRRAIDRGELSLVFQPLQRFDDGRLVGVEALVRWHHPDLGQIGPDEFIPIAEQTGQINQVGTWILHTACAALPALAADYGHEMQLGINVSAQQLRNPDLQMIVSDALQAWSLGADRLYVEITETSLLASDETTEQNVRGLDAMGVRVALDDFGTGYSSLAVLKAYPIKAIKIDRSFVDGLPEDHDNRAIVTALVGMAKSLGLAVVAEGVETRRQYAALRDLGCDMAQGYLVGRPVAAGAGRIGQDDG